MPIALAQETPPSLPEPPPSSPPTNQSDLTNLSDVTVISEPQNEGTDPIDLENSNDFWGRIEDSFTAAYVERFGPFYGVTATIDEASQELGELGQATGTNPGLVYVIKTARGLRLVLVTSNQEDQAIGQNLQPLALTATRTFPKIDPLANRPEEEEAQFSGSVFFKTVPQATPAKVDRAAKNFRRRVSDPLDLNSTRYLEPAQQLYDWIIQPLDPILKAKEIDTLIFVLDEGLRTIPVAALHDGTGFLVERYNLSLIPSFNLTDTRYQSIQGKQMLGMGITESVQGLSPLPSVAIEVPALTTQIWQGQSYLNRQATLDRLKQLTRQKEYDIIHLATHAEFNSGEFSRSFIQLWDQRVSFSDLRTLSAEANWGQNPTVELLVLSACQTALGSQDAELGFTGLALQTGVKSVLGSLWYVSDEGTLALMGEFYDHLESASIKSAALRQAQLAMLRGETVVQAGRLKLSNGLELALPSRSGSSAPLNYRHPYYWSPFTLVGNWN